MKSGAKGSRMRARVGFGALLVGTGIAAQAGCGGRYEVIDGSAGATQASASAGANVVGRAGAPSVIVTQPGNPAGAPSFGGSFGFAGAGPAPIGGSFGFGGAEPVPIAGSAAEAGEAGGVAAPSGGLLEPCYPDGSCNQKLLCESNGLCLPRRGAGTPSVCDGPGTRALDVTDGEMDDFEAPMILPAWSTFADLQLPGPDPFDNSVKLLRIFPGAANTNFGAEYRGVGANPASKPPGFGVGAIFNVAIDARAGVYCADISVFEGISFWAKTGVSDSVLDVNFILPSTNPASSNPAVGGGDCLIDCNNHPRKRVALTGTWAQYSFRFLEAAGGSDAVDKLIQEIGWFSPDSNWDFSLDEITFYKSSPPIGPVGTSPQNTK